MAGASLVDEYGEQGFTVVRDCVPLDVITGVLDRLLDVVADVSDRRFDYAHSQELARFLLENKPVQSRIYDEMQRTPELVDLSSSESLAEPVRALLGAEIGLQRKIPFRIDVPFETAELAVWHQDYFYVRGNTDIVTAWIPMQDTSYLNGCLSVMPASHRGGLLDHDVSVLGKRHFPSAIFDREVRYVPMRKGDVLLFHSCLVHSSNLNLSDGVRFSMQPRYTRFGDRTDEAMGGVIRLGPEATA
jgi:phytanoyl-CoA hydroxylase